MSRSPLTVTEKGERGYDGEHNQKKPKYLLPSNESIHIKEAMIMYIFNKWTNFKADFKKQPQVQITNSSLC